MCVFEPVCVDVVRYLFINIIFFNLFSKGKGTVQEKINCKQR